MSKQYKIPENAPLTANEPMDVYSIKDNTLHLDISLDRDAVVEDIKKAIEMIKGITKVSVCEKDETELSGIDQGLKDIEKGNIFYAKDSADLVNQIFG